jgi:hypothetical protein
MYAVERVIDLVQLFEPNRELSSFAVLVRTLPDGFQQGVDIHLLESGKDVARNHDGIYQTVPLSELFEKMQYGHWCTRTRHIKCDGMKSGTLQVHHIAQALTILEPVTDETGFEEDTTSSTTLGADAGELADAVMSANTLRTLRPEEDPAIVMARVRSEADLSNLVYEFLRYESNLFVSMPWDESEYSNTWYNEVVSSEQDQVIEAMETFRRETIGSEKAFDILAAFGVNRFGLTRDETLVHAVITSSSAGSLLEDDDLLAAYGNAIRVCLGGSDDLYSTTVTTAPRWVVELIRCCCPSMIRSKLYDSDKLSAKVLETAKTLWSDAEGNEFVEFDKAVEAAARLLVG